MNMLIDQEDSMEKRVSLLPSLSSSSGAKYTLWQFATKAISDANGDASSVHWDAVECEAIKESINRNAQPSESVIEVICQYSPGAVNKKRQMSVRVGVQLLNHGWDINAFPSVANKVYSTAVADKEALVWLKYYGAGDDHFLVAGEYWSEGRNCLESHNVSIPKNADVDVIHQQVDLFATQVEAVISETYAIKLLRLADREEVHKIALRVRTEFEIDSEWEEYPDVFTGCCANMSEKLHKALTDAGHSAKRVPGRYMGAEDDYEHDMSEWDESDIENFDPADGYKHWWIEVNGLIIDIAADQFHPSDRNRFRVVEEKIGDGDYVRHGDPVNSIEFPGKDADRDNSPSCEM